MNTKPEESCSYRLLRRSENSISLWSYGGWRSEENDREILKRLRLANAAESVEALYTEKLHPLFEEATMQKARKCLPETPGYTAFIDTYQWRLNPRCNDWLAGWSLRLRYRLATSANYYYKYLGGYAAVRKRRGEETAAAAWSSARRCGCILRPAGCFATVAAARETTWEMTYFNGIVTINIPWYSAYSNLFSFSMKNVWRLKRRGVYYLLSEMAEKSHSMQSWLKLCLKWLSRREITTHVYLEISHMAAIHKPYIS